MLLRVCLLLTGCLTLASAGCSQFPLMKDAFSQSFASMKPDSGGYDDGTDEVDGWVSEAGVEARGDRPIEVDNDPFRALMSPKAKSIERNLGIQ